MSDGGIAGGASPAELFGHPANGLKNPSRWTDADKLNRR